MPLFIGGVRDGEWHAVPPDRDYWTLAERPKLATANWDGRVSAAAVEMKTSHYRRLKFHGLKETFEFFACGMTPDQAFERLLREYRPAESENDAQTD